MVIAERDAISSNWVVRWLYIVSAKSKAVGQTFLRQGKPTPRVPQMRMFAEVRHGPFGLRLIGVGWHNAKYR